MKRPNEAVAERLYYNPLWAHVGPAFLRSLNVHVGDAKWDQSLYCSRRENGHVTENDILAHASEESGRLFLLVGKPGVGKTTFLHHVFASPSAEWKGRPVVWVDLFTQVPTELLASIEGVVVRLIEASLLDHIVGFLRRNASDRADPLPAQEDFAVDLPWWRFVLEKAPDPLGRLRLLRRQGDVAAWGPDAWSRFDDFINSQFRQSSAGSYDYIRLQLSFIRMVLKDRPLIVFDNVDQMPSEAVSKLVQIGDFLSSGRRGTSTDASARTGVVNVILALRHETFYDRNVGACTRVHGTLGPPDLSALLSRRFEAFLQNYEGPILTGSEIPMMRGPQLDVLSFLRRALLLETAEVRGQDTPIPNAKSSPPLTRADLDGYAISLIERVCRVLTTVSLADNETLAQLLHKMTDNNTRLCLVAVSHYVASGHVDWAGIILRLHLKKPVEALLSYHKVFKALLLGTQPVFGKKQRAAWALNLLSDGKADTVSLLIRPRLLMAIERLAPTGQPEGALVDSIMSALAELFAYPSDRIKRAITTLKKRGLLEDRTAEPSNHYRAERIGLTHAGTCYVRWIRDFEYIQHVAQDVAVSDERLVSSSGPSEPPIRRLRRVVNVCREILDTERSDLTTIETRGKLDLFRSVFGDELVCGTLVRSLPSSLARLKEIPFRERDAFREAKDAVSWTQLESAVDSLLRDTELAVSRIGAASTAGLPTGL